MPDKIKSEKKIINGLLNTKLDTDKRTALDILRRVSKRTGVKVDLLAANAMQEGMLGAIQDQNSEGNGDNDYPVDGYQYYGLDTFGNNIQTLVDKGYIPEGFDYKPFDQKNEKKQIVSTGAFKTNEDALFAKAAFIKDFNDKVIEYSGNKNLKLDKKTEDYLTMAAYNGGFGNAKLMIDELATGRFNQSDYVDKGLTSRKGVHKNVAPRIQKMSWFNQMATGPHSAQKNDLQTYESLRDVLYTKR